MPTIDVATSQEEWRNEILQKTGLNSLEDGKYYCRGKAYILAKQHLPKGTTTLLKEDQLIPDFDTEKEPEEKISAVKAGEITVSKSFVPIVKESKVWMNTLHVEMIQELLGEGLIVEVLDESGQVIRELGKQKRHSHIYHR